MTIEELEQNGSLFEGWHVIRFIGEGSFGKVYEVEREEFGVKDRSALKVISIPKNPNDVRELMSEGMDEQSASTYFRGFVEEFVRECQIMSRLKGNSNIVSFEDYKVVEHQNDIGWDVLIRMEMLTPFVEYLNSHAMEREDILDLGISICKALEICRKQNIIHRDIKPANIFVSPNGDYKLGDFGISRIVEKTVGASTKVGTNDYMAPEVYKGLNYDAGVDIYSLGLVLYRLFNDNRLPFLPPAPSPITHSQREDALSKRMAGVDFPMPVNADESIFSVICKATAFNSADRYSDPADMRKDLEDIRFNRTKDIYGSVEPFSTQKQNASAAVDSERTTVADHVVPDDEMTIPSPNIKRADKQQQTGEKMAEPEDENKTESRIEKPTEVPDRKFLVVGIALAAAVLTVLGSIKVGWITMGLFDAIIFNLPLLVICFVAYSISKKKTGNPWICYGIITGIQLLVVIILLLIRMYPVLYFILPLTIALIVIFGILINDRIKERG